MVAVKVKGCSGRLDCAVAARPLPRQTESGDRCFVRPTSSGWLLVVADGLGHGPEAAVASRALVEVLERYAEESPVALIRRCHERLRTTRGVALALASIESATDTLTWIGVGNVEGVLCRSGSASPPMEYITQRGGIVGDRLPLLQPSSLMLADGDTLVLATDGIQDGFTEAVLPARPPQRIAERILSDYARPDDDALVLVARWCPSEEPRGRKPS